MEDNLTSADPLSKTTTIMIPGRPGKLSQRLLTCKNPGAPDHKHWTDRQVIFTGEFYGILRIIGVSVKSF